MNRNAKYYRDLDGGFNFQNNWPPKKSKNHDSLKKMGKLPEDDLVFFSTKEDWLLFGLFIASFASTLYILGTA